MPPDLEPTCDRALEPVVERFHPRRFLRELLPTLRGLAPVDRLGIGVAQLRAAQFSVLALAATDRISSGGEGQTFPGDTTAGGWVRKHTRPFFSSSIRDVRPFPQTHHYFVTEQMESNCILPLTIGGDARAAVLYFVSHQQCAFPSTLLPTLENVRDAVAAQVESHRVLTAPPADDGARATPADREETKLTSLDEVQREHILRILAYTKGVIEGPNGAAQVLRLAPSTLRNRMRRLGIPLR